MYYMTRSITPQKFYQVQIYFVKIKVSNIIHIKKNF